MTTLAARAYLSPSLVLLAFDWPDGANRPDFPGFAIRRESSRAASHFRPGTPEYKARLRMLSVT